MGNFWQSSRAVPLTGKCPPTKTPSPHPPWCTYSGPTLVPSLQSCIHRTGEFPLTWPKTKACEPDTALAGSLQCQERIQLPAFFFLFLYPRVDYAIMTHVLWRRTQDTGKNWRHVYKVCCCLWYRTGQSRTVQDMAVHNSTVMYSTVQYSIVQYCTVLYCAVQ